MNTFVRIIPALALHLSALASSGVPDDLARIDGPALPASGVVHLEIRTFPDPCADEFTLVVPEGLRGHTRAVLLDGSYRTVLDWPLGFSETAGNRVDIPMNGLDPGTYTLRIWDEYGDAGATIIEHQ